MDGDYKSIQKTADLCIRPRIFFENIQFEEGLLKSILMLLKVFILVFPLHLAVQAVFYPITLKLILRLIFDMALGMALTALLIPFYHIFIYLFGGRNGIKKSAQIFLYSAIPVLIVSWIPFLPILVFLYSIRITIIGLKALHFMTTARAVLVYLIPFAILAALVLTFNSA